MIRRNERNCWMIRIHGVTVSWPSSQCATLDGAAILQQAAHWHAAVATLTASSHLHVLYMLYTRAACHWETNNWRKWRRQKNNTRVVTTCVDMLPCQWQLWWLLQHLYCLHVFQRLGLRGPRGLGMLQQKLIIPWNTKTVLCWYCPLCDSKQHWFSS